MQCFFNLRFRSTPPRLILRQSGWERILCVASSWFQGSTRGWETVCAGKAWQVIPTLLPCCRCRCRGCWCGLQILITLVDVDWKIPVSSLLQQHSLESCAVFVVECTHCSDACADLRSVGQVLASGAFVFFFCRYVAVFCNSLLWYGNRESFSLSAVSTEWGVDHLRSVGPQVYNKGEFPLLELDHS